MDDDPHDLQRFVDAQDPVHARVIGELAAGAKSSHWMWFVFPQLKALGRSETARRFGLADRAEAEAYARHPILGTRLRECTRTVVEVEGRTALEIFGPIDAMKFRSSMTLFASVCPTEPLFADALQKYCDGKADERTLERL